METKKIVAIISPAGIPCEESYKKGLEILKKYSITFKSYVDFSETPSGFKAFLLYELLNNKEIFYIWSARGGFGSIKLLPYLDELLNNKIDFKTFPYLIGFSDITILHLYFYKKFKKIGIHAPMITNLHELDSQTLEAMIDILFKNGEISLNGQAYQKGETEGILIGGNLTTMASLCGTPYFPQVQEIILFIEDIHERLYRLERSFLQVIFTIGKEKIKGLIIGNLGKEDPLKFLENIKEFLPPDIPIGYNFSIGHIPSNHPVIIGEKAVLKVKKNVASFYQYKKIFP